MEHYFTRSDLYNHVWSRPVSMLASDLGTTTDRLVTLLRRANIPTPSADYWTQKELGATPAQSELPPAAPGCLEPLLLETGTRSVGRPASLNRSTAPRATASNPPQLEPTILTREALYQAVWTTPLTRLAEQYGVSGGKLAKICERENIPYPKPGYWSKHAVGKAPAPSPLPRADDPIVISTPATRTSRANAFEEAKRQVARSGAIGQPAILVQKRLVDPHQVIGSWLAEHKEMTKRARREQDPWSRKALDPGKLTATEHRRHRILDALFKGIERQGGRISEGERNELVAELRGAKIAFQIREKQDQMRRPLTSEERQVRLPDDNMWKQELVPTGRLMFLIKTPQWPAELPRQWLESGEQTMERMLPDILAIFLAAGPLLVQRNLEQEAADHERRLAEYRWHETQRQRRCDVDRWLAFKELAQDWEELATVRDFLRTLRSIGGDPNAIVDGRSVAQWIVWADEWLSRSDPIRNGVAGVFTTVARMVEEDGIQSNEIRN
jgi:hypothetical protein